MRDPTAPPSMLPAPQLHVGYTHFTRSCQCTRLAWVPSRRGERRFAGHCIIAHISPHDTGHLEERTLPQFAALAKLLEATCQFEYLEIRRYVCAQRVGEMRWGISIMLCKVKPSRSICAGHHHPGVARWFTPADAPLPF